MDRRLRCLPDAPIDRPERPAIRLYHDHLRPQRCRFLRCWRRPHRPRSRDDRPRLVRYHWSRCWLTPDGRLVGFDPTARHHAELCPRPVLCSPCCWHRSRVRPMRRVSSSLMKDRTDVLTSIVQHWLDWWNRLRVPLHLQGVERILLPGRCHIQSSLSSSDVCVILHSASKKRHLMDQIFHYDYQSAIYFIRTKLVSHSFWTSLFVVYCIRNEGNDNL